MVMDCHRWRRRERKVLALCPAAALAWGVLWLIGGTTARLLSLAVCGAYMLTGAFVGMMAYGERSAEYMRRHPNRRRH